MNCLKKTNEKIYMSYKIDKALLPGIEPGTLACKTDV